MQFASLKIIFLILIFVICFGAGSTAQQSITAERINEHVVLFKLNGVEYMGFDLEASKALKQAENDAKAFKAQLDLCHDNLQKAKDNTQDERVRVANIQRDYDAQSKLFDQCMALSGNGPKWSKYWLLDLGLKTAPIALNLARNCD